MDEERIKSIVSVQVKDAISQSQIALLGNFETLLASKLNTFKSEIQSNQKEVADIQLSRLEQNIVSTDSYKFQKKGCQEQFKFNAKVCYKFRDVDILLDEQPVTSETLSKSKEKIAEGISVISQRQKMLKLADSSELGWKVVNEYQTNPLADDSDDEKRIHKAEARAARKQKQDKMKRNRYRFNPYFSQHGQSSANQASSTVSMPNFQKAKFKPGLCFRCGKPGHWRAQCGTVEGDTQDKISIPLSLPGSLSCVEGVVRSPVSVCVDEGSLQVFCTTQMSGKISPAGRLRVIMFLDDDIEGESSAERAGKTSSFVQNSLTEFGFLVAEEKCVWDPKQTVTWLGLVWDFLHGTLHITDQRLRKLTVSLESFLLQVAGKKVPVLPVRFVASLIEQIISCQPVFGCRVRLLTRALYKCVLFRLSWASRVVIADEAVKEILFWKDNCCALNGRGSNFAEQRKCDCLLFSDASGEGYGGYCSLVNEAVCKQQESPDEMERCRTANGELVSDIHDTSVERTVDNSHTLCEVVGSWDCRERLESSTWREIEAVHRVLSSCSSQCVGRNIQVFNDNNNAIHILRTGSSKDSLQRIAMSVHDECVSHNISIFPKWIPRDQNTKADRLSRCSDSDWGPHSIDRFASDYNAKCKRFNSRWWCPGTEGIDCFHQEWANQNNWLVPPPRLICKAINKIRRCNGFGTLIIPAWTSAPFWPLLTDQCQHWQDGVKDVKYLTAPGATVPWRGNNGIFGLGLKERVGARLLSEGVSVATAGKYWDGLVFYLLSSRSDNTVTKYFSNFRKWKDFAQKMCFDILPAQPVHVAIFMTDLLDSGASINVLTVVFYALKWA